MKSAANDTAAAKRARAFRGQTWDAAKYAATGRFVADLAGGVMELLAPQAGEAILDLGCGDGALTEKIAASGAIVTGVDASPGMVAAARARGLAVHEASADAMGYEGEFDAVFSNAALHWMPNAEAVIAGVWRALKPGGRFVAEMGGHGNIAAIRVALMAVLGRHGYGDREDSVNYYPTAAGYERRLVRHGFHVDQIALFPRPTPLTKSGIEGWLRTFRRGVIEALPEQLRDIVVEETTELLAPALRDQDGNWTADYMRLRFIAIA